MSQWMRRIVTALGALAAVNLVACAALLSWLFATDRMDGTRFGELRRWMATPIAEERAMAGRAESARRTDSEREVELVRLAIPPRSAAERSAEIDRAIDQAQLRRRLVDEQGRLLGQSLEARLMQLHDAEKQFEESAAERQQAIAAEQTLRNDAQFKKTVALLDASPAKQSKEWMLELLRTGRRAEAVRYLDAMSKYAASRLMRELKGAEETALAADLLEALRRRSIDAADDTQ